MSFWALATKAECFLFVFNQDTRNSPWTALTTPRNRWCIIVDDHSVISVFGSSQVGGKPKGWSESQSSDVSSSDVSSTCCRMDSSRSALDRGRRSHAYWSTSSATVGTIPSAFKNALATCVFDVMMNRMLCPIQ
jgi:hypothetical protein